MDMDLLYLSKEFYMYLLLPEIKLRFELDLYLQWISLVRSHVQVVVDDEVIFPVFKKLCKVHDQPFYVFSSIKS